YFISLPYRSALGVSCCCKYQLVSKAFVNASRIVVRGCSSTLGDMSQGYVDSPLRCNVYRYRVDDTTVGDSRHVFCRCRVLYRADEDLDRILVSLDTYQFESVLNDANRASLATPSNSGPHHIVDQPFHNVDCRFSKTLMFVSTAGVRKENRAGGDVAL